MLRKYFCSPVDLIGDRAAVSPLGGGGGNMDLTVKVEGDEEDDEDTVGRTAPNWLQELNGANNSVNSSWDSGVVLDTNTVVQMAEFQEIIDSLQKCGAGEGMALPPPPYNSSTTSNSNHHLNNNTNSFHVTQQQQQPVMSSAPPPTVVLSPSSSPPPVASSHHQFLYPDLELEQMLLLPPQRLGAASYHGGDSSALLTAAEKLGRGGVVTCQSLPLLTDQQATLAAGNSNSLAVSSAGEEHYALQLRCAAGDCTQEPLSLVCHPFARKLLTVLRYLSRLFKYGVLHYTVK